MQRHAGCLSQAAAWLVIQTVRLQPLLDCCVGTYVMLGCMHHTHWHSTLTAWAAAMRLQNSGSCPKAYFCVLKGCEATAVGLCEAEQPDATTVWVVQLVGGRSAAAESVAQPPQASEQVTSAALQAASHAVEVASSALQAAAAATPACTW